VRLFSHSLIRWLAVRRKLDGESFWIAGQGMLSRLEEPVLPGVRVRSVEMLIGENVLVAVKGVLCTSLGVGELDTTESLVGITSGFCCLTGVSHVSQLSSISFGLGVM